MNNKLTIPHILVGAGLLVCAALAAYGLPALMDVVYELPRDIAIVGGLLSILILIMFAMFIYVLTMQR